MFFLQQNNTMQNIYILCYKILDFYDIQSKKNIIMIYSAKLQGMLKGMKKQHKNIVQILQH